MIYNANMNFDHLKVQYSEPIVTRQFDGEEDLYKIVIAGSDMGVDLSRMDVTSRYAQNPVVLFGHDHSVPIGKTVRGPYFEDGKWIAEFKFADNDPAAERYKNLYEQGILNAASIGFYQVEDEDGEKYPLLLEWSMVVIGMDKLALAIRSLNEGIPHMTIEKRDMEDTPVVEDAVVEEETATEEEEATVEEEIAAEEETTVEEEVVEEEEDEDEEEEPVQEEYGADTPLYFSNEDVQNEIKRAIDREKLAIRTKELLPIDFDVDRASTRELLVAAVGNEVSHIEERSDDYLRGRLDAILERRARGIVLKKSSKQMEENPRPRNIRDIIQMNREVQS